MIHGEIDSDDRAIGYWWTKVSDTMHRLWHPALIGADWDTIPEGIKYEIRCIYRMAQHQSLPTVLQSTRTASAT